MFYIQCFPKNEVPCSDQTFNIASAFRMLSIYDYNMYAVTWRIFINHVSR